MGIGSGRGWKRDGLCSFMHVEDTINMNHKDLSKMGHGIFRIFG
jgi:hypothetical protein